MDDEGVSCHCELIFRPISEKGFRQGNKEKSKPNLADTTQYFGAHRAQSC
jgi:hypothetical protein